MTSEDASGVTESLPTPRALPFWKKVVFSLIVCTLFFLALEVVLRVCGITPLVQREDPYVGFSSYIPLFVKDTVDGQPRLTTSPAKLGHFNAQQFSRSKPENTFRIFCVGGSTTYGRPYNDTTSFCGWLREFLPAADPSRHWEVVNAGGVGYASYRVAKLMEELVHYEPDLFIIYSGHNEFLERRTYAAHFDRFPVWDSVRGLLAHSRTYAALRQVLPERSTKSDSATPKPAEQLPGEVVTLLEQSVGLQAYERDDALRRLVLKHYRLNLGRMIQMARDSGAEVMLVVPASNLRDSSPFKSEPRANLNARDRSTLARLTDQVRQHLSANHAKAALKVADQALDIDSRFAELHYRRGRALLALGRYEEARAAFVRAVDEDICPLRAFSEIQQIVREVASEQRAPCVDFVALVDQKAEHGIPGTDLFLDHVHPTIAVHRLLAKTILDQMIASQTVHPCPSWGPEEITRIATKVEGSLDQVQHGIALRNLSKVMGWAGKLEESLRLAKRAVKLAPEDAETHLQLGIIHEQRQDLEKAETYYRRAVELDESFQAAYMNLGVLLGKQEKLAEARTAFEAGLDVSPNSPMLLANLAKTLAILDDFEAAIRYQRQAVEHAPPDQREEFYLTLQQYQLQHRRSPR
ncbi:MAG: tetratricopeptide repeat protein [Pirellulaceae bacterium]